MVLTRARRQQVLLLWIGIGLAWGASIALEIMLLESAVPVAVVVTTTLAVVIGVVMTRRATSMPRRAAIKVHDLRSRRVRRREARPGT